MTRLSARAYLDAYRARCAERGLDPATGEPRVFVWPAERQQPDGRPWWCDVSIWADAGEAHSSTEREAVASVAATARKLTGTPEAQTPITLRPSIQAEVDALAEDGRDAMRQMELPLREIHARRGETVAEVLGQRMIVPIKVA